ncbi:MAG: type 1 glutamine amidotransferase domain-containing protein [Syntrophorhabdales bacterium]|jgi:protease I
MKVLMISADEFEDLELFVPYYRLQEEGIEVTLASLKKGKITGKHGYEAQVDKVIAEVNPATYDALILPGGKAPAKVRQDERAVAVARYFMEKKKPVAAICHGPQILITAGVLKGRHATCYKSVAKEMKEAGVVYEDKAVVVDGKLVTSRQPSDLPFFLRETMNLLKE